MFWVCFNKRGHNFNDVSRNGYSMPSYNKLFWNKEYDVRISVHYVISKIFSRDSNYIIDVVMWPQFYKNLTRINTFYEEWSWLKFENLGLALDMALKFYGSVKKRLKLKARRFWRQIPRFIEVTGKNWQRGSFCAPLPLPIFNRINLSAFVK